MRKRTAGWRRVSVTLSAVFALATGGLVAGSGAVLLGPTGAAAAATPFPDLPANASGLATVNAWRAASGLGAATKDPAFSAGGLKHSTYIVETGLFTHEEDPAQVPWYSAEGNDAGLAGNIAVSSDVAKTDRKFVDQWMTAPFHAAGVLDPTLQTSGFGSYRKVGATPPAAATLDVLRGRSGPAPTDPTFFPGDDSTLPVAQHSYRGGETPDPLSACPADYNPGPGLINTGTPLFALLPNAPEVGSPTTATVERDGVAVDSCVYDENSYMNPVPADQALGRSVLATRHQVVVVPRLPMVQGSVYTVEISVTYAGDTTPTDISWEYTAERLPKLSIGNSSVVEGNLRSRLVRLTVTLSEPYRDAVTVSYATVAGNATAGSDFVAKNGTLTIPAGGTSGAITVPVKGDRTSEPQETFTIVLSNHQNARRGRATGIATIINDDSPSKPAPHVSIASSLLVEGDTGTRALRFGVTLSSSSPTAPVTVHYETAPMSADASDFNATSGTLTIPARAVSAVVLVRIKPDTIPEEFKKFTVTLSDPTGATLHPTRKVGTGTISDDD